jgi:hypothetical protein
MPRPPKDIVLVLKKELQKTDERIARHQHMRKKLEEALALLADTSPFGGSTSRSAGPLRSTKR